MGPAKASAWLGRVGAELVPGSCLSPSWVGYTPGPWAACDVMKGQCQVGSAQVPFTHLLLSATNLHQWDISQGPSPGTT